MKIKSPLHAEHQLDQLAAQSHSSGFSGAAAQVHTGSHLR
jgi:hypothetical protein